MIYDVVTSKGVCASFNSIIHAVEFAIRLTIEENKRPWIVRDGVKVWSWVQIAIPPEYLVDVVAARISEKMADELTKVHICTDKGYAGLCEWLREDIFRMNCDMASACDWYRTMKDADDLVKGYCRLITGFCKTDEGRAGHWDYLLCKRRND